MPPTPATVEEFHGLVTDLAAALADVQSRMAELVQAARAAGTSVSADDLLVLHNLVSEAQSVAANAVSAPQGTPTVPDDTGATIPSNTTPAPAGSDTLPEVDPAVTDSGTPADPPAAAPKS